MDGQDMFFEKITDNPAEITAASNYRYNSVDAPKFNFDCLELRTSDGKWQKTDCYNEQSYICGVPAILEPQTINGN
uniref:C-type lectin domain-containing protein n=1 Tax=Panagrolaimus sp. JU765 TaxID=591449 RepID=A0AC34RFS5_9BILA